MGLCMGISWKVLVKIMIESYDNIQTIIFYNETSHGYFVSEQDILNNQSRFVFHDDWGYRNI